ncbi:methyltransferase type 11 [Biscogniauxia marginata]|nr:methyltransferase type 11 [Biscogniauxia marginata]
MSQNVYDQPEFFQGYIQLDRQTRGLDGAPEWPQLRAMLPDLKGQSVLDLGCGFGWFSRYAREQGATFVRAIDLSENMLEKARSMTKDDNIEFQKADLDRLKLPESQYDAVFSSLTLHYLVNLPELVQEIAESLKPSGRLVYSIEHPIFTAPSKPGFLVSEEDGRKFWPIDGYQKEGLRTTNWFMKGVKKQHRTVATYITMLLKAGLEVTNFVEWRPDEEDLEIFPEWADEIIRPTFLLIGATKSRRE